MSNRKVNIKTVYDRVSHTTLNAPSCADCSRFSKKINGKTETKGLLGTIDVASLSENAMLLTIPLREVIIAESLADSFSIWGTLKK